MESLSIQQIFTMIARFALFWQCFSVCPGPAFALKQEHKAPISLTLPL